MSTALKSFIENEVALWTNHLQDIEGRFLASEELDSQVSSPPTKRKKTRKGAYVKATKDDHAMAELAATLQIDYMKKVTKKLLFMSLQNLKIYTHHTLNVN